MAPIPLYIHNSNLNAILTTAFNSTGPSLVAAPYQAANTVCTVNIAFIIIFIFTILGSITLTWFMSRIYLLSTLQDTPSYELHQRLEKLSWRKGQPNKSRFILVKYRDHESMTRRVFIEENLTLAPNMGVLRPVSDSSQFPSPEVFLSEQAVLPPGYESEENNGDEFPPPPYIEGEAFSEGEGEAEVVPNFDSQWLAELDIGEHVDHNPWRNGGEV